ncbi:tape measure protein [Methylococcus mesophilus]|uniref:tape measure protein n=1 Tax=Methylococcus mesophilus TaxID=2993564 RepID=UPI00224B006B|nr:tape measure protein [Methylococcus mesophilus]UZR27483.1 tape measure protein [Methylococcus mesophilus]
MAGPIVVGIKLNLDEKGALVGVEKVESGFKRIGSAASESASRIDASYKKVETGIAEVENGFKRVGSAANESAGRIDAAYGKTRQGLDSISTQLATAKRQFLEFITAQAALGAGRELADVADRYANLSARLKLATQSELEYAKAQAQVFAISQRYSTALDDNAKLYSRIAPAARDAGKSQADLIKVIEGVNASLKTSGASAAEQSSTITQLSQSLASSTVQWEDFGQLADTNMRLVDAVAKQLGGSMGDLKQKMSDGLISNTQLFDAIIAASEQLKAEAATMPNTIGGAVQQMSNAWEQYIGKADQAAGASRQVADAISGIAGDFDDIADAAIHVGEVITAVLAVKAVQAIGSYVIAAEGATLATRTLGVAVSALGGPWGIAAAAITTGGIALHEFMAQQQAAMKAQSLLEAQMNVRDLVMAGPDSSGLFGATAMDVAKWQKELAAARAEADALAKSASSAGQAAVQSGQAMAGAADAVKKYTATEREDIQSKVRWLEAHGQQTDALRLEGVLHGFSGKALEAYVTQELDTIAAKKANAEATKVHNKALSEEASTVKKAATEHQNAIEASDKFIQSLKDQLQNIQDTTGASEAEQAARKASIGLIGKEADERSKLAKQLVEERQAYEGAERIKQLELKTQNDIAEAIRRKEETNAQALQSAQAEEQKQLAILAQLQAAHEAGYGPEALARMKAYLSAVYDVTQGMGEEEAAATAAAMAHTESANQMMSEMTQTGQSMLSDLGGIAQNMMGSFTSMFFDPFGSATANMGQQFSRMLQQMASQLLQSVVMRFFTGGSSGTGSIGGLIGSVGSWFGGSEAAAAPSVGGIVNTGAAVANWANVGDMFVSTGGGKAMPVAVVDAAGAGTRAAGTASSWLGGPGWASTALGYAGAGIGGLGTGYLIGNAIGGQYTYGREGGMVGGAIGGMAGYAGATIGMEMAAGSIEAALASTGIGAIVAAIMAAVMSSIKKGQPDATAQYSWQNDSWTLNKQAERNGGNLAFLGNFATKLFQPLTDLEKTLAVRLPAFNLNMRQHEGYFGMQIPGLYSARMKADSEANKYMAQAVSIGVMRLFQQPAVTSQMADPLTKAVVMLSGDLQAFGDNIKAAEDVRKYAAGASSFKVIGKSLDLSGGSAETFFGNMKEAGALRTFLGELTPNTDAFAKLVQSFQQMEDIAKKFGVSVDDVHKKVDQFLKAAEYNTQDRVNQLLGKPQSIGSKVFNDMQSFDQIAQDQRNNVTELAKQNKAEAQRGKNLLNYGDFVSLTKSDQKEAKGLLNQLNNPELAGNPEMLAQWQAGWDAYWQKQIDEAQATIKNPKKLAKEIKRLENGRDSTDALGIGQVDIDAAKQQYIEQQRKAYLDEAKSRAGVTVTAGFAERDKANHEFFEQARAGADALGLSLSELADLEHKAADQVNKDWSKALEEFAGNAPIGDAAERLQAIADREQALVADAIATGRSVVAVYEAGDQARKKAADDFARSQGQIAGTIDQWTAAFQGYMDNFKGWVADAKAYGTDMSVTSKAIIQTMKDVWENMVSGIESARQAIAQQIAELRGPQAVADLAVQNVDKAKQKLADYRAGGGTDISREIALIQGVQSAVMARYNAELALIQQAVQKEVEAIQAKSQADIEAINETLNAQIEAENERLNAAIEAENAALNARIEAINAASQAQIDAINQQADAAAEARQEAQQAAMDALNEQLQTANQLKNAIKGIADYAKSLQTAADSPLSPEARLNAAKNQYEDTLAKAKAGDAEAAARYQQDAEAYKSAAKDYYASSAGYGQVYGQIQSDATALGNTNVTSPDSVESQLKELRKQQSEENKAAQKAVQDQIKAVQSSAQDQIKEAQKESQERIKAMQDASKDSIAAMKANAEAQIKAIQTASAAEIKKAQDLDSRPDVQALKKDTITQLELLDKDLVAAYDAAAKQYQTFLDSLAGVVGANTTVIGSLVEWLRSQGVNVTAPPDPDPGVYEPTSSTAGGSGDPRMPPHHAAGGHYRGGLALVGELGPELINFNRPGYVHTADETARILAAVSGSGSAASPDDQINQMLGGLPFDPRQLLSMFSAANDAHGAYANILDLPPTWPNAAAAVQSLMLKPTAAPQAVDMPSVGYQPPTRPTVSRQTAQIEDRLSRIEANQSGTELKGLKEALESIRRESKAGVNVQSAGFSQLLAVMNQMLARLEEIERRSRYAS